MISIRFIMVERYELDLDRRIIMHDMPFIPGILLLLLIFICITRVYMTIAENIGEKIRMFFIALWQRIKK